VDVRQVVFARRQETIAEAARRMRDFHVGTLVVIDGQDGRRPRTRYTIRRGEGRR
jgi:predicted transcriptional regulator